ncbi:DsrE family protein [Natrinema zhouii]|uniref:DsrE family protein n=1 Tax=Natrinema zhouii TaxID=1710539 RepID=A0A7D6GWZ4_9EURY|nr:DsrE family protein [Natrinema zhouii]QLK26826.1 DsrE family protein [Natrinema zhouii]
MQTVFHVSSPDPGDQQHAMVNALNLLADNSVSSSADDVAIVANGAGVRMFVTETASNRDMVDTLREQDVTLLACRNSLDGMGATDADLLPGVEEAPSGSGALARFQDEGYGYIKAP